ncbi:hypothetical protein AN697_20915 [Enterobacter cloacae subsp. cloacae]|nr:hypothetical protein AN697_20915 [Enterobacter cloacae subsp. cloacae]
MSPSPGDTLVCCVKRAVPGTSNWYWYRQDYTQQFISCGGGASTCRPSQNRRRYTLRNVFISKLK